MTAERLTLAALAEIDGGRLAKAFAAELERIEADCKDRPETKGPRKVTLAVVVSPADLVDGELSATTVEFQIDHKLPKRASRKYVMGASTREKGLFFQELSPENPRQLTLPGASAPVKAKKGGASNAG